MTALFLFSAAALVGQGSAPASIRLKFTPNDELVYRMVADKEVLREGGEDAPYRSRMTLVVRRRTTGLARDQATLQLQCERLIYQVAGAPQEGAVDTDEPPGKDEKPEFAAFRSMVGKIFEAVVDVRGRIRSLKTVDKTGAAAKGDAAYLLAEGTFRNLLQVLGDWLPEAEYIEAGRPWSRREETPLGPMTLVRTTTLTRRRASARGPLMIDALLYLTSKSAAPAKRGAEVLTGSLSAQEPGKATIAFDAERGQVEAVDVASQFRMRVDATAAGVDKKTKTFVLDVRAQTKVELIERDGRPIHRPPTTGAAN